MSAGIPAPLKVIFVFFSVLKINAMRGHSWFLLNVYQFFCHPSIPPHTVCAIERVAK
jgi:hypothetical protein